MTDHQHHWAVASIDPNAGGRKARRVRVECTAPDCDEYVDKLTERTDAEIEAELQAANG
jgi:hypothetical protein